MSRKEWRFESRFDKILDHRYIVFMASDLRNIDESDMVNSRIEQLAKKAFSKAYKEALASEDGVAAVVDGVLYQVYKDGTKKKKRILDTIKFDISRKSSGEVNLGLKQIHARAN